MYGDSHAIAPIPQVPFRKSHSGNAMPPSAFSKAITNPQQVSATVVAGHQVASGQATQSPYPQGTIEMQMPHFLARGVDLSPYFPGTLNVSIAPHQFELCPPVTLADVKWSPEHAAESFSFVPIELTWVGLTVSGLIYYPRPETKINHFQDPSVYWNCFFLLFLRLPIALRSLSQPQRRNL